MSRGGALVLFLLMALLLGGIANTTPVPAGVIGFAVVVVALLCWIAAGTQGH